MLEFQGSHSFIFRNAVVDQLSEQTFDMAGEGGLLEDIPVVLSTQPVTLDVDAGVFTCRLKDGRQAAVGIVQENGQVTLSSDLPGLPGILNPVEATVLTAILRREELGVFFRPSLRSRRLRQAAIAYGLEHEPDLDRYLMPVFAEGRLTIQPRLAGLLPINSPKLRELGEQAGRQQHRGLAGTPLTERTIAVISRHKYYRNPVVELIDSDRTKSNSLKAPFTRVDPLKLLTSAASVDEAKFYAAIARLQQVREGDRTASDLEALETILKNDRGYPFYYHDDQWGENFSSKSLVPVKATLLPDKVRLSVRAEGAFYAIMGEITLAGKLHALHELSLKFNYFFLLKDTLYLVDNVLILSVAALLKESGGKLLIHASKYRDFQRQLLDKLADSIRVEYPDVKSGTVQQLIEMGFTAPLERLIYLSDFGNHVMIIPVVRYGEAEVAIRTEKQVKAVDGKGNDFLVPRDDDFEQAFMALLIKQHPHLPEQLDNQLYYFYLHKKYFLDEEWFLSAFDVWHEAKIEVFGFNELTSNKLNPNRVTVDIKVISGLNWFNATHEVRFGKKKASLKKIQAALRNKRRYVALDDGTMGILPQEWLEKFAQYFEAGEVVDDETIRFAKVNFDTVTTLYDAAMLDETATAEIGVLRERIANFESIQPVAEPRELTVRLRPYQRQGLDWLGFLDSFNFGGILADEMGLGKTVQIIAFMLSQRENGRTGTDLVVVPATLIFNWQRELATLAPSLTLLTLYGVGRTKSVETISRHDVVLTSYATLLADIRFLKNVAFNYVYLDESQNIKNPDSQRYKSAKLLQARNRIAISGTPFENSSFDLYGQLSFACPGLLGDKRYFRDVYAKPIDQFKNQKRRKELQQKIQPFILRRTKQDVAADLPEKVSMVLYSEMGDRQRKIYDAYEKEFRDFISALSGEELDNSPMHMLRGLTRLRQICNSPALLPDGMLNTPVSAKIELLKEQIQDKSPYHKVVIFSQFVSMLHLVGHMLDGIGVRYVSLTGSTRAREQVVNTFQEDPEVRVFLVSLKAGGTGLNLTAAEIVYLVDPWWNPAVENQAIDRVHRIGQEKKVMAYRLVTPNTVEEKVLQLQAAKDALADGLVRNDSSFFRTLDKERLLGLL
ncbi:DEAD/DEAH box helicase [Parapedobacter koreensis]|uniref:Superfamily II DNA or RNA helicase, SNF2 family n=1 Tax=Parapedobacter koreensis TaxID=332977 RepID=A0A1H7MM91_9SPHI|nr:DEAD/DEAH box helicase [Parapedobacter koreensis]SEL12440.1 Superfamily II DNA or RNA helicase, SNF2 family [Parapedobacter koreensis]